MTLTVRDVMTTNVHVVRPQTPINDVARLLVDFRISGVPVEERSGEVVGVVSEADILLKETRGAGIRRRRLASPVGDPDQDRHALDVVDAATAGAAMSSPALTIGPDRSVAEAAATMLRRGVNRLPVVDDGRLVGIVTRADLVRGFARSDAELCEAIREDVLRRTMWRDPDEFDVAVRDGIVAISGSVERRSTAELLERVTAMVPGVVRVIPTVRWCVDDSASKPRARNDLSPY